VRYLLEILAFTFGANYSSLIVALCNGTPATEDSATSLLSTTERANLLHHSFAVNTLLRKIPSNTLSTVPRATIDSGYTSLIEPASFLSTFCESYVLQLISAYAYHQCKPSQWNSTLVRYWSRKSRSGFKDTLSTHAHLIAVIAPNEHVQGLLGRALERYQDERGLKGFRMVNYYWPRREGCEDLEKVIGSLVKRGRAVPSYI
jgi:hypothetical protein